LYRQLQLPQFQFILREFERQAAALDMKGEIMEDCIDQAVDGEEDEEERFVVIKFR